MSKKFKIWMEWDYRVCLIEIQEKERKCTTGNFAEMTSDTLSELMKM
jgi:hypothetical protein